MSELKHSRSGVYDNVKYFYCAPLQSDRGRITESLEHVLFGTVVAVEKSSVPEVGSMLRPVVQQWRMHDLRIFNLTMARRLRSEDRDEVVSAGKSVMLASDRPTAALRTRRHELICDVRQYN